MELKNIKLSDIWLSGSNPRGTIEKNNKSFEDLVASIKEKGVLVPILVRPKQEKGSSYEVVAGSRRVSAAKAAGLKEIPAKIEEMTDDEAMESAIVENLQREDVHPLEEGEAYRKLIEDGGRNVKDVAVKVGKPEAYVRQRLFLTNLVSKGRELYRKGGIKDTIAYELARLSPSDQELAFKKLLDAPYRWENIRIFREWIAEHVNTDLAFQPWITDKATEKAVGPCTDCPPNRPTLFGAVKEGQCVSRKCWAMKMERYVAWLREKDPKLVAVTLEYGEAPKGVLSRSKYEEIPKLSTKGKDGCKQARAAIVVQGKRVGKMILICVSPECKKHGYARYDYESNPEEKKKQREKAKKERRIKEKKYEMDRSALIESLGRLTLPLSQKHLDALFDFTIYRCGGSFQQPVCKLFGLEVIKTKRRRWDNRIEWARDYEATLRKFADTNEKKVQVVFALLMPEPSLNSYDNGKSLKEALRKI
jgi:ParB family transcriptional regulator, chromosome partitioning protein